MQGFSCDFGGILLAKVQESSDCDKKGTLHSSIKCTYNLSSLHTCNNKKRSIYLSAALAMASLLKSTSKQLSACRTTLASVSFIDGGVPFEYIK